MDRLFENIVAELCATQDLRLAFHSLQKLLKPHTRIEGVFLGHYVSSSRELYQLAHADSNSSLNLDYKLRADDALHDYLLSSRRREMNVFPMLRDFPAMARTLSSHIPDRDSLYEFRVRLDGRHIGMLAFHTPTPNLSEDAVNLLMKIRGPVALALANRLRSLNAWPETLLAASAARSRETFHIRSRSPAMRSVYKTLQLAAPTNNTLLLTGETGVGKEVFARCAHALSARNGKPFVHVNCGGIAETLIDSELFGHKKGAFTGAFSDHAGFFEQADGGTIFLDEIGELPQRVQARLLLALQNKVIRRVGDSRSVALDVRVVAATNGDLERMCREGTFRKDLYYRLNCITAAIPPLRARKEDIPALAEHFLRNAAQENGCARAPDIPPSEMEKLVRHSWPGNVRELENCVKRSFVFSGGDVFRADLPDADSALPAEFPAWDRNAAPFPTAPAVFDAEPLRAARSLDDSTRSHMEGALRRAGGRVHGPGGAAELLGVNPSTLRSRMRKLNIPFGRTASALYK